MAQPSNSTLRKRLEKVLINPAYVRETGSEIGRGAYGVVVELEAYGMRCAGKRLHEVFFSSGRADETNEKILSDFANEILQMRKLRHPNIVQFLGIICTDTSVTLVMEFIPTTLRECLEKYCDPNPGIPSFIKNSLLLDIAQGLLFLHCQTPAIIHRDLSSNNVLITSTWQAKICDLGVAKAIKSDLGPAPTMFGELNPSIDSRDVQPMSILPGTDLFMPPECRKPTRHGEVVYGPKLDCFSFGNLIVMVVLQVGWLENTLLSDVPDDATSEGRIEVKRRSYHLSQMEDHPLQGMATQCLLDDPEQRPSADDIVRTLKEVTCDDPPPFANTLDLYKAFVCTKGEESKYQKKIAELKQQNQERIDNMKQEYEEKFTELKQKHEEKTTELRQEHDEKFTELKQKHDEKFTELKQEHKEKITELRQKHEEKTAELKEYRERTKDLTVMVEELKSELQKQKELIEGRGLEGRMDGMQLTSSPNRVSRSDAKTDRERELTTTAMSCVGTLQEGWTAPQDTRKPACTMSWRPPQVTPRQRAGTQPVPRPRPRPRKPRPVSVPGNGMAVTGAVIGDGIVSPTGDTTSAIAPTDGPGTPRPRPRARKPLRATLSADSFKYISQH